MYGNLLQFSSIIINLANCLLNASLVTLFNFHEATYDHVLRIDRCGEDEHPLNELLILQLGLVHPNGRYNISMCKIFSNHWGQEKRKFLREAESLVSRIFILEVSTYFH